MVVLGLALSDPAGALTHEAELVEARFDSLAAALEDAVRRYLPRSVAQDREQLGAIFASTGPERAFVYSVAEGRRGRDELTVRLRTPPGFRLAALWHTHGAAGQSRKWFSPRDTALAVRLGVPIYLATAAGKLRVFRPGGRTLTAAQASRRALGVRAGAARGRLVDLARLRAPSLASAPAKDACGAPAS